MMKKRLTPLSLLTLSALLLFGAANIQAQSETTDKSTAAPGTKLTPGQKPESTPTPVTGTIQGRLVASDGQPLTNANVMAQGLTSTPSAKPTRVDSDGRFVFDDLPPAAYIIVPTAPGYIAESVSLGEANRWPRHLIGSNVSITMIRGGVITGMVTNAKGDPIVGVPVHATMQDGPSSITSFLTGGGISETDDRGIYRIYGLLPGQYTVNAGGSGQFGQFTPSGFDVDVPTYYPSATRDTAVPVSVRSGDETSGIDIKYKGLDGHAVSGVILGAVGPNALSGAITIFISHAGSASVLSIEIASLTDPRRSFSFNGIADGEYEVFASYLTSQTESAVVASKRVTVRGIDVTGVELSLTPLGSIAGTITLDPIKPEEKCDKRGSQVIEVIPSTIRDEPKKDHSSAMIAMLSGGLGLLSEKGEFALRNLEATRYRLDIKLPTESWYVRAINVPAAAIRSTGPANPAAAKPNANTWQGTLTLKSGEKLGGVSIMVGQDAASLHGRMGSEGATIREGTRVHLVPVDREQGNNILRYSETFVKSDGSFALGNIAPGRYLVLTRVEGPVDLETPPKPVAWDVAARAKLRLEAEKANTIVELKPCQQMIDYPLKPL